MRELIRVRVLILAVFALFGCELNELPQEMVAEPLFSVSGKFDNSEEEWLVGDNAEVQMSNAFDQDLNAWKSVTTITNSKSPDGLPSITIEYVANATNKEARFDNVRNYFQAATYGLSYDYEDSVRALRLQTLGNGEKPLKYSYPEFEMQFKEQFSNDLLVPVTELLNPTWFFASTTDALGCESQTARELEASQEVFLNVFYTTEPGRIEANVSVFPDKFEQVWWEDGQTSPSPGESVVLEFDAGIEKKEICVNARVDGRIYTECFEVFPLVEQCASFIHVTEDFVYQKGLSEQYGMFKIEFTNSAGESYSSTVVDQKNLLLQMRNLEDYQGDDADSRTVILDLEFPLFTLGKKRDYLLAEFYKMNIPMTVPNAE